MAACKARDPGLNHGTSERIFSLKLTFLDKSTISGLNLEDLLELHCGIDISYHLQNKI